MTKTNTANNSQSAMQAQTAVIDRIFATAQPHGGAVEILIDEESQLSFKAKQGELSEQKLSHVSTYGLRIIKDNRVGLAYTQAVDQQSIQWLVDRAFENAQFAQENHHEHIQTIEQSVEDDGSRAPAETASVETFAQTLIELESRLLSAKYITSCPYNGIVSQWHKRRIVSNKGVDVSEQARTAMLYAYALGQQGDKNAMEGFGHGARLQSQLNAESIITEVEAAITAMLAGEPIASGHHDIIFSTECLSSLFNVFSSLFSGKSVVDGISGWKDMLNSQVAVTELSLYDEPINNQGLGFSLIDAEGLACQTTSIIASGTLVSFLHNSMTANTLNTANTGHASRTPQSSLNVSPHQLAISPGSALASELLAGSYLEITDLTGLHSGANAISGDFSFGASGYLCRDGQRQQSIRGITLAGNFLEMLLKIQCIGDTQAWTWQKSAYLPSVRFGDIAISG